VGGVGFCGVGGGVFILLVGGGVVVGFFLFGFGVWGCFFFLRFFGAEWFFFWVGDGFGGVVFPRASRGPSSSARPSTHPPGGRSLPSA